MGYYTIYTCKRCKRDFITETEEVNKLIKNGKYLVCPFCSHKDLHKSGKFDSLIECYINSERRR
jgi:DNA-directed RNA polymerase subunit RPC12/RpoP